MTSKGETLPVASGLRLMEARDRLFAPWHRLFLALWASDGGRTDTEGRSVLTVSFKSGRTIPLSTSMTRNSFVTR